MNNLGCIYLCNQDVPRDINKAIYYLSRAANQGLSETQYNLAFIYHKGILVPKDMNKAIYYYYLAAEQNHWDAQFTLGVLNHEGKYIKQDISKATRFYIEVSFINHFAKNNLALVYKNIKDSKKNIYDSIELFKEIIHQYNDELAIYNLAHIYYYGESNKKDKSIFYLIKSKNKQSPARMLLSLILANKLSSFTLDDISKELKCYGNESSELVLDLFEKIKFYNFEDPSFFEFAYEEYKNTDYYYDSFHNYIPSFIFLENNFTINPVTIQNNIVINNDFYEGFGLNI